MGRHRVAVLAGVLCIGVLMSISGVGAGGSSKSVLTVDRATRDGLYLRRELDMSDRGVRKVRRAFEEKMSLLSPGDITGAVDSAVEATGADRDLVLRAVFITSRWGRLESLDKLREGLRALSLRPIVSGAGASLADAMVYLYHKKCQLAGYSDWFVQLNESDATIQQFMDLSSSGKLSHERAALLLDDVTLRRLHVPGLARLGVRLVAPYGWVGGLTVFAQLRYAEVIRSIAQRVHAAEGLCMDKKSKGDDGYMNCVVDTALMGAPPLRRVDIPSVQWIGRMEASALTGGVYDEAAIAENLKPDTDYGYVSDGVDMAKGCVFEPPTGDSDHSWPVSSRFEEEDYLQYLLQFGTIVSMNRLAQYVEGAYESIMERFPDKKGEMRLYCIPEAFKSTSIVYHLFFMTTPEDPRRLRYCPQTGFLFHSEPWNEIIKLGQQEEATTYNILLVDDLSISGEQQADTYKRTRMIFKYHLNVKTSHVRVVPLIYSEYAAQRFKREKVKAVGGRMYRDGGRGSWMLQYGFHQGRANIVLPYMAPDNNNLFFSQYIAKAFTFHGCGVKNYQDLSEYDDKSREQLQHIMDPMCAKQAAGDDMKEAGKIIECLGDPEVSAALVYCYRRLHRPLLDIHHRR